MAAYHAYETIHASLAPARAAAAMAEAAGLALASLPGLAPFVMPATATAGLFARLTRRYPKPSFGIASCTVDGRETAVHERAAATLPFCRLVRFERDLPANRRPDPVLLLVAPMSGHHATLLRDAVMRFLPFFDVHVTDWTDASEVPAGEGNLGFDGYVDHVTEFVRLLGPGVHVMAVCQPAVPVLAAVAAMAEDRDPCIPASLALLGGPVDTRSSPTAVNRLADEKGQRWFEGLISTVPLTRPGYGRKVYPGFMQLSAFMSMNAGRHASAFGDYWLDSVAGNGEAATKHRDFYDEYLAVMDLDAEFYLDTIRKVFVEKHLPEGRLEWKGRRIDPRAIENVALMTVEGELDDITGRGQTEAAHGLCPLIPASMRASHVEKGAGHYGIFSGRRFREGVAPAWMRFAAEAGERR